MMMMMMINKIGIVISIAIPIVVPRITPVFCRSGKAFCITIATRRVIVRMVVMMVESIHGSVNTGKIVWEEVIKAFFFAPYAVSSTEKTTIKRYSCIRGSVFFNPVLSIVHRVPERKKCTTTIATTTALPVTMGLKSI